MPERTILPRLQMFGKHLVVVASMTAIAVIEEAMVCINGHAIHLCGT